MKKEKKRVILLFLSFSFFAIGFFSTANDVLIPVFRSFYGLSYSEVMGLQFSFFTAYAVYSLPFSKYASVKGYRRTLSLAFGILTFACAMIILFVYFPGLQEFFMFLILIFCLAGGVVLLSLCCQPLALLIDTEKMKTYRLSFLQAFHSIGASFSPWFFGFFLLDEMNHSVSSFDFYSHLQHAYIWPFLLCLGLFLFISFYKFEEPKNTVCSFRGIFKNRRLNFSWITLFLCIGAEICVGSFLITLAIDTFGVGYKEAKVFASLYWFGLLLGRLAGGFLLKLFSETSLLKLFSLVASVLLVLGIFLEDKVALYALTTIGLFNSIMLPTIFSLGLSGLNSDPLKGSGVLTSSIAGGAIVPLCTGLVADQVGIQNAFFIPLACFIMVYFYAKQVAVK